MDWAVWVAIVSGVLSVWVTVLMARSVRPAPPAPPAPETCWHKECMLFEHPGAHWAVTEMGFGREWSEEPPARVPQAVGTYHGDGVEVTLIWRFGFQPS
jgi:hypothetical protein